MVSKDGQAGLQDEPIQDREIQAAIKAWHEAHLKASTARQAIKTDSDAKDKVRDLLPGMGDGQPHRYTFVDELGADPIQYVVRVRPGPPDKKVPASTRTFQPRLSIDAVEPSRS